MANNSRSSNISIDNVVNEPNNRSNDLILRLFAQISHNLANPTRPLTYVNFPSTHPGYLNLEQRTRFVSIIRTSSLADQYRFGSSIGNLYIKNTNRHPVVTAEMIGEVIAAESGF